MIHIRLCPTETARTQVVRISMPTKPSRSIPCCATRGKDQELHGLRQASWSQNGPCQRLKSKGQYTRVAESAARSQCVGSPKPASEVRSKPNPRPASSIHTVCMCAWKPRVRSWRNPQRKLLAQGVRGFEQARGSLNARNPKPTRRSRRVSLPIRTS